MESDEQAVREVHAAWIQAVNSGDLARLLTQSVTSTVVLDQLTPEPMDIVTV